RSANGCKAERVDRKAGDARDPRWSSLSGSPLAHRVCEIGDMGRWSDGRTTSGRGQDGHRCHGGVVWSYGASQRGRDANVAGGGGERVFRAAIPETGQSGQAAVV